MKTRRLWNLLTGLLLASMLLAACAGGAAPTTAPATGGESVTPAAETSAPAAGEAASGDKITIGGALCLTGIQAPLDEPAVRGAQLAVDYLNSKGGVLGKQLEFVNLDGKSDPPTVGNVAVQLIDR